MAENDVQRVFELYVDQLRGDSEAMDEMLLVRLRWFSENIKQTADRLSNDPEAAVALVQHLSTFMQELDQQAGATSQARDAVASARRLALLLLPDSSIPDEAEPKRTREVE